MQRIDMPDNAMPESIGQQHLHRRSSVSTPVMAATIAAMTTILCIVKDPTTRQEGRPAASSFNALFASSSVPKIHSGPFRVEGFEHEVRFIDDGFTLLVQGQAFRIQRIQAFWSDLAFEKIKDIIGEHGITHIDCDDGLCMHSGNERSLHISQSDFARILNTMNDPEATTVTIDNIQYKLKLTGWSTLLIPREGESDLTFERQILPPLTLAATDDH